MSTQSEVQGIPGPVRPSHPVYDAVAPEATPADVLEACADDLERIQDLFRLLNDRLVFEDHPRLRAALPGLADVIEDRLRVLDGHLSSAVRHLRLGRASEEASPGEEDGIPYGPMLGRFECWDYGADYAATPREALTPSGALSPRNARCGITFDYREDGPSSQNIPAEIDLSPELVSQGTAAIRHAIRVHASNLARRAEALRQLSEQPDLGQRWDRWTDDQPVSESVAARLIAGRGPEPGPDTLPDAA